MAMAAAAPVVPRRPPTRTSEAESEAMPPVEQRRVDESEQIGRNDPCWCGIGQEVQEVPRRLSAAGFGRQPCFW